MDNILYLFFIFSDFAVAAAILSSIVFLKLKQRIDSRIWKLFWTGVLIGLTWELGCNIQMIFSGEPVARFLKPLQFHFIFFVISHSIWDGGLFIAGIFIIKRLLRGERFSKFSAKEIIIFILWGQVQELAVEMLSISGGLWEWQAYWWNPSLFSIGGRNITLLPQIIWLAAVIVYYPVVLKVYRKKDKPISP